MDWEFEHFSPDYEGVKELFFSLRMIEKNGYRITIMPSSFDFDGSLNNAGNSRQLT